MVKINPQALFTDEEVRVIKVNLMQGVTASGLARRYGCSVETIGKIKRGLTYSHVKVPGEEALRPQVNVVPRVEREVLVTMGLTEEELEQGEQGSAEALKQLVQAMGAEEKLVKDERKGERRGDRIVLDEAGQVQGLRDESIETPEVRAKADRLMGKGE